MRNMREMLYRIGFGGARVLGVFDTREQRGRPFRRAALLCAWCAPVLAFLLLYAAEGRAANTWNSGTGAMTIDTYSSSLQNTIVATHTPVTDITSLTITNNITLTANDFFYIRDNLSELVTLNMAGAKAQNNTMPAYGLSARDSSSATAQYLLQLQTLTLPTGVVTLEANAFRGLKAVTTISIPGNTLQTVGEYAFMSCGELTTADLPDSVKTIGTNAFFSCYNLDMTSLPSSLTSIGTNAFYGCTQLTLAGAVIPSGVTTIGANAFQNCKNLVLSANALPSGLLAIGAYAFSACNSVVFNTLPSGITSINANAFENCWEITLGEGALDNVITIGQSAFTSCKKITVKRMPSVTSLGKSAFAGCSSITEMTFPAGMTELPERVMSSATSLKKVVIPSNITSIGASAFEGCTALEDVSIPSGVTSIGNLAFSGCNDLTDILIHADTLPTLGTTPFKRTSTTLPRYFFTPSITGDYAGLASTSSNTYVRRLVPPGTTVIAPSSPSTIYQGVTDTFNATITASPAENYGVAWEVNDTSLAKLTPSTSDILETGVTGLASSGAFNLTAYTYTTDGTKEYATSSSISVFAAAIEITVNDGGGDVDSTTYSTYSTKEVANLVFMFTPDAGSIGTIAVTPPVDEALSGLSLATYTAGENTLTFTGTANTPGTYTYTLNITYNGSSTLTQTITIEIQPAEPDFVDMLVDSTATSTYTVKSGEENATIFQLDHAAGTQLSGALTLGSVAKVEGFNQSGLTVTEDVPGASFTISGIAEYPGTYQLAVYPAVNGVAFTEPKILEVVVEPMTEGDVTLDPAPPLAWKSGTVVAATTYTIKTSSTTHTPTVELINISAAGLLGSGLTLEVAADVPKFTISGTAAIPGTSYFVSADIEVDGEVLENIVFPITIEPMTANDITLDPDTGLSWKSGTTASGTYTITTTSAADYPPTIELISVGNVTPDGSNLTVTPNLPAGQFTISGTAGAASEAYLISADLKVDGVLIEGAYFPVVIEPMEAGDIVLDPATPLTWQSGMVVAGATYAVKTSPTDYTPVIELVGIDGTGLAGSGLGVAMDAANGQLVVSGTASAVGASYGFTVDLEVDGAPIENVPFTLAITAVTADVVEVTGGDADAPSTVTVVPGSAAGATIGIGMISGYNANSIVIQSVTAPANWADSGLQIPTTFTDNTFTITGTASTPGTYTLDVNVLVNDSVVTTNVKVVVGTVSEDDVTITPDGGYAIQSGRPANGIFRVTSDLAGLRVNGVSWVGSAGDLSLAVQSDDYVIIGDYATTPGSYTANVAVSVGGVAFNKTIDVTVDPMTIADITISPDKVAFALLSGIPASLDIEMGTNYHVPDFAVTSVRGASGFEASGLVISEVADGKKFSITGTPATAGSYTLLVDATMNGTTVTGREILIDVADLTADDIAIAADPPTLAMFGVQTEISLLVTTPFEGAELAIEQVTPGGNWEATALTYTISGDRLNISGTPEQSGVFPLTLDISVGGRAIEGIVFDFPIAQNEIEVERGRIENFSAKGAPLYATWGSSFELDLACDTAGGGDAFPAPSVTWTIAPDKGYITVERISSTKLRITCLEKPAERAARADASETAIAEAIRLNLAITQATPTGNPTTYTTEMLFALGDEQPTPVTLTEEVKDAFSLANIFLSSSDVIIVPGSGQYIMTTDTPDWQLLSDLSNVQIDKLMADGDILPECFVPSGKDSINIATDVDTSTVLQVAMLPLTYRVTIHRDALAELFGSTLAGKIMQNPTGFLDELFYIVVIHKEIKQGEWRGYFTRLVDGIMKPADAIDKGILRVTTDGSDNLTLELSYFVIDYTGEAFVYKDQYLIVPDGSNDGAIVDPIWLNTWETRDASDLDSNTKQGGGSGGGCTAATGIWILPLALAALCAVTRRKRRQN